jgi:hypothetical protein
MTNLMHPVDYPDNQSLTEALFVSPKDLSEVKCHDITRGCSRRRGPQHAVTRTTQDDITTGPSGIYY